VVSLVITKNRVHGRQIYGKTFTNRNLCFKEPRTLLINMCGLMGEYMPYKGGDSKAFPAHMPTSFLVCNCILLKRGRSRSAGRSVF
jgi:hypothetical protein